MTAVDRARLKPGKRIRWKGRTFSYCGFSYRALHLKEENVSQLCVSYLTGFCYAAPIYEVLSQGEILEAEVIRD
jgi:hypothetical protein